MIKYATSWIPEFVFEIPFSSFDPLENLEKVTNFRSLVHVVRKIRNFEFTAGKTDPDLIGLKQGISGGLDYTKLIIVLIS